MWASTVFCVVTFSMVILVPCAIASAEHYQRPGGAYGVSRTFESLAGNFYAHRNPQQHTLSATPLFGGERPGQSGLRGIWRELSMYVAGGFTVPSPKSPCPERAVRFRTPNLPGEDCLSTPRPKHCWYR